MKNENPSQQMISEQRYAAIKKKEPNICFSYG